VPSANFKTQLVKSIAMENKVENKSNLSNLNDESLVSRLSGFKNDNATVNGLTLHYVEGGAGEVLMLLPGWPETWWSYHKVMPALARDHHVIAVDLRGMGSSDKPEYGYEKQQMADDIAALVKQLGFKKINIVGHDIGASVAFSFAAKNPELTQRLVILDTPPPDENMYKLPMLPMPGYPHPWWVAFNQVKDLPEQLLAGRFHYLLDCVFDKMLIDKTSVDSFSRAVYAQAYDSAHGIRASNAWYQAFLQDIQDFKKYGKLSMPVLGIGGSGFELLKASLPALTDSLRLISIDKAGHFIQSEQPEILTEAILSFLREE
jgi:pimeloyl-ACP methyl ester carboxylesterase